MIVRAPHSSEPVCEYAVVDVETTGFSFSDRIVEIAAVVITETGEVREQWETLVQPDRDIPNAAIHGIDASLVVGAPRFAEVAGKVAELLNGRVLVAHNAPFDTRFIQKECQRAGVTLTISEENVVDTLPLARRLLPGHPGRLNDCLKAAGIENQLAHSALGDAAATAELLMVLRRAGEGLPRRVPVMLSLGNVPRNSAPALPRGAAKKHRGGSAVRAATNWLQRITRAIPRAAADPDTQNYRRKLRAALVDHHLSATEIEQLVTAAADDGLDRDDVAEIHRQYLRQMAVAAWSDGVVEPAEREQLLAVAKQLGVDRAEIDELLEAPVTPADDSAEAPAAFALQPGDRVAFTGQLTLPRDEWSARATGLGLEVGGLTRSTVVLVAANPDTMSGKARRARSLGVPIVNEAAFASLIRELSGHSANDVPAAPVVSAPQEIAEEKSGAVLPWLEEDMLRGEPFGIVAVARAWQKHWADRVLAEMSPLLNPGVLPEGVRPDSAIGQRWLRRYPQPLEATLNQVADLRGVGKVKLRGILHAIIQDILDTAESDADDPARPREDDGPARPSDVKPQESELEGSLRAAVVALGETENAGPEPADSARISQALDAEWEALLAQDWRYAEIIAKRHLGGGTLEELGRAFDVSRERVRQLQNELEKEAARSLPVTHAVAAAFRQVFLPVITPSAAVLRWSFLGDASVFSRYTWLDILTRLSPGWVEAAGYLVDPSFINRLRSVAGDLADDYGVVSIPELAETLGCDKEVVADLLAEGPGLIVGDNLLTKARSHGDRGAALLHILGKPVPIGELATLTAAPERSMANALQSDPRIQRVSRIKYALVEWGGRPYTTIADWIGQRVDDEGGAVSLDTLISEAPQLDISATSVRTYADSPEFVLADGMVARASADEVPSTIELEADPTETTDLYFVDGGWRLLATATRDHLRGSGQPLATWFAVALQVPYRSSVELETELGPVSVYVNRLQQTSLGSVKSLLETAGITVGERFWLVIDPDQRTLRVEKAVPRQSGLAGAEELRNVVGLPESTTAVVEDTVAEVNRMLGLEPDAPRRKTVSRFNHRRQEEIAELVRYLF